MASPAVSFPPTNLLATGPEDYYSSGLRARFLLDADRTAAKIPSPAPASYAKIGYAADEVAYGKRVQASLTAGNLPSEVPVGWPTQLSGPLAWDRGDFPDENEYVYYLTEEDKLEISNALKTFKGLLPISKSGDQAGLPAGKQETDGTRVGFGLGGHEVSKETFPLPVLGEKLVNARNDVYKGRGFAIVRGLDPDTYAMEDLTVVYLGITSYVGERRGKQDQRGSMLSMLLLVNF